MNLDVLADRWAGATFMLAAAVLFATRWPMHRLRAAWIALIVLGTGYGLALNLQPANFPHPNFVHYYLGAKYPAPYGDTYKLVHAALGLPQIGMRDLDSPGRVVRATEPEQRAYYIDLLRAQGVSFTPLAPLDSLAAWAGASGAIEGEARAILAARLPASRIEEFRQDVRALCGWRGSSFSQDYGYNGSPFYGLLRQLDPTLHAPYGPFAGLAGLAWQLLGVAALVALVRGALGLSLDETLAAAALVVCGVDFANFALPGLIFTELWVPVALAAWAIGRGRAVLAGAAIAIAGLLKLFPFGLALALGAPLLLFSRGEHAGRDRARALRLLLACGATALVLGGLSSFAGHTWSDFIHKIAAEFRSPINMINDASLSAGLVSLGIPPHSLLPYAFAVLALVALAAMMIAPVAGEQEQALPLRMLIVAGAMGWLIKSWLNYYVILPFLLLPLAARRRPRGVALVLAAFAASYALPAFDDPRLAASPLLHALKLVPYVATPAWLAWLELRAAWPGVWLRRVTLVAATVLIAATGYETWRLHTMASLANRGASALAASRPQEALAAYEQVLKLAPRDPLAQRKRAIALATLGRLDQALPAFATAESLAPDDPAAHDDYGRALVMAQRYDEASAQLEHALKLSPDDPQVLASLAQLRLTQDRQPEAMSLLVRARELAPEDAGIRDLIQAAANQ